MTDEEVIKARDFALAEIIKLTDSYRDMKINSVMSAETARSAFADGTNYFLKVELECTSVCAAPLSPASTCRRGGFPCLMFVAPPTVFRGPRTHEAMGRYLAFQRILSRRRNATGVWAQGITRA